MGAILATALSEVSGRTVTLSNHAVIGAQTVDLDPQIDRALWTRPHVAVIMIGANDVTHLVPRAFPPDDCGARCAACATRVLRSSWPRVPTSAR